MIKFAAGLMIGAAITSTAAWALAVSVPTNGILAGYIVQKDGKDICRDPEVHNQFRGSDSYIVCP